MFLQHLATSSQQDRKLIAVARDRRVQRLARLPSAHLSRTSQEISRIFQGKSLEISASGNVVLFGSHDKKGNNCKTYQQKPIQWVNHSVFVHLYGLYEPSNYGWFVFNSKIVNNVVKPLPKTIPSRHHHFDVCFLKHLQMIGLSLGFPHFI